MLTMNISTVIANLSTSGLRVKIITSSQFSILLPVNWYMYSIHNLNQFVYWPCDLPQDLSCSPYFGVLQV